MATSSDEEQGFLATRSSCDGQDIEIRKGRWTAGFACSKCGRKSHLRGSNTTIYLSLLAMILIAFTTGYLIHPKVCESDVLQAYCKSCSSIQNLPC